MIEQWIKRGLRACSTSQPMPSRSDDSGTEVLEHDVGVVGQLNSVS